MQELGVSAGYKLERTMGWATVGFLKKGGRKRPGWFVHATLLSDPITRLPPTLTEDEAKSAAKLVLLSLED